MVIRFLFHDYNATTIRIELKKIFLCQTDYYAHDFSIINGQSRVKRILKIAASGSHNLLMVGPPGNGKTILAPHLPDITMPSFLPIQLHPLGCHLSSGRPGLLHQADAPGFS